MNANESQFNGYIMMNRGIRSWFFLINTDAHFKDIKLIINNLMTINYTDQV